MVRFRKLQRKGADGSWGADAYAIETESGRIVFRYPITWEHIGGLFNNRIDKEGPSLEDLDVLLDGSESLRWAKVETLEIEPSVAIALLDVECGVKLSPVFEDSEHLLRQALVILLPHDDPALFETNLQMAVDLVRDKHRQATRQPILLWPA